MKFVDIEKEYEVVQRTGNFVICLSASNSYIAFECGYGGIADFVGAGDLDQVKLAISEVEGFNKHYANLIAESY